MLFKSFHSTIFIVTRKMVTIKFKLFKHPITGSTKSCFHGNKSAKAEFPSKEAKAPICKKLIDQAYLSSYYGMIFFTTYTLEIYQLNQRKLQKKYDNYTHI